MKDILFGAIIGDMCSSSYERSFNKDMELDKIELITPEMHFTDDTVCSIAIADVQLLKMSIIQTLKNLLLNGVGNIQKQDTVKCSTNGLCLLIVKDLTSKVMVMGLQ